MDTDNGSQRRISAAKSDKSDLPISVRVRKKAGRDYVRAQIDQIAKSEYVESFDEGDFVRFAIEFTARCLGGPGSFPKSAYDQVTDDVYIEILGRAMDRASDGAQTIRSVDRAVNTGPAFESFKPALVPPDLIIPSRNYDYSRILAESNQIWLVFNDMYNWLGNHDHRRILEERIRANQLRTNIYLIHPESPVLDYVAAKSNKLHIVSRTGDNRQLYDIKRSLFRLLENVIDEVGDRTRVVGHQWVHAYSMVMNEAEAYLTPYLNKRVGNDGIIHVYHADSRSPTGYVYRDLKDDLEDMVRYTTEIANLNLVKYMQEHREFMNAAHYPD
jgi:hypothetical protein